MGLANLKEVTQGFSFLLSHCFAISTGGCYCRRDCFLWPLLCSHSLAGSRLMASLKGRSREMHIVSTTLPRAREMTHGPLSADSRQAVQMLHIF